MPRAWFLWLWLPIVVACTEPGDALAPVTSAPPVAGPGETAPAALAPAPSPASTPGEAPVRAETLELSFVGDVVLGRYLEHRGEEVFAQMHPPEADPFAAVAAILAADVVVANLESPVVSELPLRSPVAHRNRFAASAAHLGQLRRAGFTVLSLANNHAYDLGEAGQREGPGLVADANMRAIGAARTDAPGLRVESFEHRGWRIGFVALATVRNHPGQRAGPWLPYVSLRELGELAPDLLGEARAEHDLLVVVVHWGKEYADEVDNSNRLAARALIDAGADLVIGHHPHVLQAIERRSTGAGGDGLIAYSLGNFLFPRNDGGAELSGVLRTRYRAGASGARACLEAATFEPVYMHRKPRWHPEPATAHQAGQVHARLDRLSRRHKTRIERADETLIVAGLQGCGPTPAGR